MTGPAVRYVLRVGALAALYFVAAKIGLNATK
jgi:hypothetical protein